MLQPYPGFIGGSYTPQSPMADCEDTINWYPEVNESPGAKAKVVLYPTPGMSLFSAGTQAGRALFSTAASGGRTFLVEGTSFVELAETGVRTVRGTVAQDANPATITTNGDGGDQLFITSGGNGYNFDLNTNTLTAIANLAGKATMGGFAYGYFLCFDINTGTVYLSDLFDGTTWDPTQYFQRSIGSDAWQAMIVTSWGQIFLPGSKTRDYWYNTGQFPIPFEAAQSGLQPDGTAATFSALECAGAVTWLATNNDGGYEVYSGSGYRAERISNHAVEYDISNYSSVDDAVAASYKDQGHTFYLLKFPTAGVTWAYDFATRLWHKRQTWTPATGTYAAWRPTFHAFAWNTHLWIDVDSGSVYESDVDVHTDVDGLPIRRVRQAPSMCRGHLWQYYGSFEVLMQTGVGNTVDPGANPQIVMQTSNDGGQSWGNERHASIGRIGQTTLRVYWHRCGRSRDRAFRLVATDPVPYRIIDAFLDVTPSVDEAAA